MGSCDLISPYWFLMKPRSAHVTATNEYGSQEPAQAALLHLHWRRREQFMSSATSSVEVRDRPTGKVTKGHRLGSRRVALINWENLVFGDDSALCNWLTDETNCLLLESSTSHSGKLLLFDVYGGNIETKENWPQMARYGRKKVSKIILLSHKNLYCVHTRFQSLILSGRGLERLSVGEIMKWVYMYQLSALMYTLWNVSVKYSRRA